MTAAIGARHDRGRRRRGRRRGRPLCLLVAIGAVALFFTAALPEQAAATRPSVGPATVPVRPMWWWEQQVFTASFDDRLGAKHLDRVTFLLCKRLTAAALDTTRHSARIVYDQGRNRLRLQRADGSYAVGTPGAAVVLHGARAQLDLSQSSVTMTGGRLTLRLSLGFTSQFAGTFFAYGKAVDDRGLRTSWKRTAGPQVIQRISSPYETSKSGLWSWYKGQVHCHSANSPGPEADTYRSDLLANYRTCGYEFVVITDHNWVGDSSYASTAAAVPGVMWIRGEEDSPTYAAGIGAPPKHLGCLGLPGLSGPNANDLSGQQRVDWVLAKGGFPVLNHPFSSHGWPADFPLVATGVGGVETHNATESLEVNDQAIGLWDGLSQGDGKSRPWALAGDDAHTCVPYDPIAKTGNVNFNRGWIVVRSSLGPAEAYLDPARQSALRADIMKNIKAGNFFAVERDPFDTKAAMRFDAAYDGPHLTITVAGATVTVTADGICESIRFYEAPLRSPQTRLVHTATNVASASYELRHDSRFVRVVADQGWYNGRPSPNGQLYRVYSQPITVTPFHENLYETVNGFESAPSHSPWVTIDKAGLVGDLRATVLDPLQVNAGGEALSGPAAVVYELVRRRPARYAQIVDSLYGSGAFRGWTRRFDANAALVSATVPAHVSPADWMLLATLRAQESGSPFDPLDLVLGVTSPTALEMLAKELLFLPVTRYRDTSVAGDVNALEAAELCRAKGGSAFLLIDGGLFSGASSSTPDQWAVYLGGLKKSGVRISFDVFSNGSAVHVSADRASVSRHLWGLVVVRE